MHVLIVGGGLAGPALAVALARRRISSTIFEIRRERGDSGGSITLAPNALQALDKAVGVYDRIKAEGFVYRRLEIYADDGYKFGSMYVGGDEQGYPAVRLMRSKIHEILLDATREYPAFIKMVWGAKVTKVDEEKDQITAHFEDGSSSKGDILVGADGIHSKVREFVLGACSLQPIFSGSCTVSCFVSTDSIVKPAEMTLPSAMFTPSGMLMIIPFVPDGSKSTFGISIETEEKTREGFREFETSGEAAQIAKRTYAKYEGQPIRSLLDNTDDTKARVWSPYGLPDLPKWHSGRVLLIGDAAHALPPNGQGSAQAFEDAAYLSRLLSTESAVAKGFDKVFSHFETKRRPRIEMVKQVSKRAGQTKSTASPWVWWAKKWAIWAMFAWNRWEIRDSRLYTYDPMAESVEVE